MTLEDQVAATVVRLSAERGAGKTICPSEAARAVAGADPDQWSRLMPLVRRVAIRLMKDGRVVILRKGRRVDPDDFKGVYRIAPAGAGEGSSDDVLPDKR